MRGWSAVSLASASLVRPHRNALLCSFVPVMSTYRNVCALVINPHVKR